jgi:thiamine-phosphate pyrophosphorylase
VTALRGLYAITPGHGPQGMPLANRVRLAVAGGARMVQYRDKTSDADRRRREIRELLEVCRAGGVPLIVNDDVELALEIGADGVHLGRDDPDPAAARRRLGPEAIIGVSCYGQLERAREAQAAGADYVAFGRFFPSATKPQATPADPGLLRRARRELGLPLVAIGGITPENAPALLAAGADLLAVIHGVFGQDDVRAAAAAYARLFPA